LTNNDILRRLRYTFNFNDKKMIGLFGLADHVVTREQVSSWLKKEEDPDYVNCSDTELAIFLNGFINDKRGKKEGPQHPPEKRVNNNIILTKLKIALNLKAEDIVSLLASVDLRIGKAELSAFSRKPDHKHYRLCKDQIIRNLLQALQDKHRKIPPPVKNQSDDTQSYKIVGDKSAGQKSSVQKNTGNKSFSKSDTKKSNAPKTIYHNPNATKNEKPKSERKVLKLKPEDIWK